MAFNIGDRVQVSDCSGVYSGQIGTIVPRSKVITDGRGKPTNIAGAYKPLQPHEAVIRLDAGILISMFYNRLVIHAKAFAS